MRDGGAFGNGYQWETGAGQTRITITCHNLSDVGKPDAVVYKVLARHIPCPDCGAPRGTSCVGRSPERGPHQERARAARKLCSAPSPIANPACFQRARKDSNL
jgi:hypothetical protein